MERRALERGMTRLLELSGERGLRCVVRLPDEGMCSYYDEYLWTYNEGSFLAHGTGKGGDASYQPVWITSGDENPNGSEVLMVGGSFGEGQVFDGFGLVCYVFGDDYPAQKEVARGEWRRCCELVGSGEVFKVSYWQEEGGKWVCKKEVEGGVEV